MITAAKTWPMSPARFSPIDDPYVWVLMPRSALPEILLPAPDPHGQTERWLRNGNELRNLGRDLPPATDVATQQSEPNSVRVEPTPDMAASNRMDDLIRPARSTFSGSTGMSNATLANIGYVFVGHTICSTYNARLSEGLTTPRTSSPIGFRSPRHQSVSRSGSVTPRRTHRSSSSPQVSNSFRHPSKRPDRKPSNRVIQNQSASSVCDAATKTNRNRVDTQYLPTCEPQSGIMQATDAINAVDRSLESLDNTPTASQEQSQLSIDQLGISEQGLDHGDKAAKTEGTVIASSDSSEPSTVRKRERSVSPETGSSANLDDNTRCPQCKRLKTEHEDLDRSLVSSNNSP